MKYLVAFLIVLMLIDANCSRQLSNQSSGLNVHQIETDPSLSLGMSHELALEIIRDCGGQDITSRMAIQGPQGESPSSNLYWSLKQYDSVLEIAAVDGKVSGIGYWTADDFSENKVHRLESRRSVKSLKFEKLSRTLKTQDL